MNQHHTNTAFVVDGGGIPGTQTVPFQQRTMEDMPLSPRLYFLTWKTDENPGPSLTMKASQWPKK